MANFEELSMVILESSYKGGRRNREIEGYNSEVNNMYADADDSKKDAARIIRNDSADNRFDNNYDNNTTQKNINYLIRKKEKASNDAKTKNPLLRRGLKKAANVKNGKLDNEKQALIDTRRENLNNCYGKAKTMNNEMRSLLGKERQVDQEKENRKIRLDNIAKGKEELKNSEISIDRMNVKNRVRNANRNNTPMESVDDLKDDLKLVIYESCEHGEITKEQRDLLLANLD